jgi:hypothetical protein
LMSLARISGPGGRAWLDRINPAMPHIGKDGLPVFAPICRNHERDASHLP